MMAEDRETIGDAELSDADQNLQTLDALHLDGKGAPVLEDADERSLSDMGDARPEDVTGNANVQSAGRSTFEQMVQGGIREQPVVPTGDNVVIDTVQPTFRDNNVAARFDNVQPVFAPGPQLPDPERRPERDEPSTRDPAALVTGDPLGLPRGLDDERGDNGAPAAAPNQQNAPEAVAEQLPVEDAAATPTAPVPTPAAPQPAAGDEPEIPKVADSPAVVAAAASGVEDRLTRLDIAIDTADRDGGDESISAITIAGVPAGFGFVDGNGRAVGTDNGDGTWSFKPDQIKDLYLRQPEDYSGDLTLTVSATAREANGTTATTTATMNVHVEAVADAPSLTVADSAGMENTLIPLTIGVGNNDAALEGLGANAPETQQVYIAGLPAGATLFIGGAGNPVVQQVPPGGLTIGGTTIPGGAYVVAAADLPNLLVRSAPNDSHDFTLRVWSTSTEGSNGDTAVTGFQTIEVDVGINAPSVAASGSAREGEYANLDLSAAVNFPDGSNSEQLSVFVTDLPPGAELRYRDGTAVPQDGNGRYEVTGRLGDLKVGWSDADSDTDITFKVVAEVQDGDSDSDGAAVRAAAPDVAVTSVPVTVTIQAVADGPAELEATGIGVEDKWFDLDITTGLLDAEGETLTVTVTGPAGFQLADGADTDTLYQGKLSADGKTVTYELTAAQLENLKMRAAADSDADLDLTITATTTETGPETTADGQVAVASVSKTIPLHVQILSDADKPVVSVVKDTQIIAEDTLFDLRTALDGQFSDGVAAKPQTAVGGASAETGSERNESASPDGSETIVYRITANQESRVSTDGNVTSREFHKGDVITVTAEDIASGKVQLGGPTDWASSNGSTLTFTVVTVATEARGAADDALETPALDREAERVSDPAILTISVTPDADVATATLAVVASGYEDGLPDATNHAAGARGDGIAVQATLTLSDADLSEAPTGRVVISSDDPAMLAGKLTIEGADIVRQDVVVGGKVVSSTWTITGADFSTTDNKAFHLDGLTFHPAADSDADPVYDISVQFRDTDGGTTAQVTASGQTIAVQAVADQPDVTADPVQAWESAAGDRLIDLDISVTRGADTDGSETLYVYVTDLPPAVGSLAGANVESFKSGTFAGLTADEDNPVYRIPAADLGSLQLKVGAGISSDVVLKVVSTSVEQDGGDEAVSLPTTLRVDIGVLDPVISGNPVDGKPGEFAVSGVEDSNISLSSVSVAVTAAEGHETRTVYVEAPAGVTLYGADGKALERKDFHDADGAKHSGFDVSKNLTAAGALDVTVKADAAGSDANYSLKVFAIVADADATDPALNTAHGQAHHDTAQSVATVQVTVRAEADAPDLSAASLAVEDKWVKLDLAAALTDSDGSENLTVTIAGVPAGLNLSWGAGAQVSESVAGDGSKTYTIGPCATNADMQTALAGLKITGLDQGTWANTDGSFPLTVTATASETAGDAEVAVRTKSTSTSLTVDILSNADKPLVTVESATQTIAEDAFFDLHTQIGDYFAVEGRSGEAGSAANQNASADNSESLSFRISPVESGSRLAIDLDGNGVISAGDLTEAGKYWNATGKYWEVPAALVNGHKVYVGGAANWASAGTADANNLHFDIRTVATEARDAGLLDAGDLSRANVAVGDPMRLTLNVTPVADSTTITATGGGIEDQPGGIAITPTIALGDTDGSEKMQGFVEILVKADANGNFPGSITYKNATLVDGGVETYESQTYHVYKVPVSELAASGGNQVLNGLKFVPTTDSDLDIQYRFRVTTVETANGSAYPTVSGLSTLAVSAVADAPLLDLTAPGASKDGSVYTVRDVEDGGDDRIIRLDLSAQLKDRDGSEVLTNAELRDVPKGWGVVLVDKDGKVVSALSGTDADKDGDYTFAIDPKVFAAGSALSVALVPPANSDVDSPNIVFWAKSTEVTGAANPTDPDPNDNQVKTATAESSLTFKVELKPQADPATLNVTSARGNEDAPIALDIRAAVTDADESVSLVITGVPKGGVLTYMQDGHPVSTTFSDTVTSLTVTPEQARTLTFTAPEDASGKYTLTVTAITTDTDTENPSVSDSTSRSTTLDVYVKGVNDEIVDQAGKVIDADSGPLTAGGIEDNLVNLGLGDYSVADADHSETLSAVISGLPKGFSLMVKVDGQVVDTADVLQYIGKDGNGQPIWSVPESLLKDVYVDTPADYAGTFSLSVRLVTTEKDGAATAIDKVLNVSVTADADAPSVSVSKSISEDVGTNDGIVLDVTIRPADTTPESAEHISQITINVDLPPGLPADTPLTLKLGGQTVTVGAGAELTIDKDSPLWSAYDPASGKLSGLTVLGIPNGWSTDIPVTVTAVSTDINGDTAVTTTHDAEVTIAAVVDTPTWELGAGATQAPGGGFLPDIAAFDHGISNLVLYIETGNDVLRVKIDNFSDVPTEYRDVNSLDLQGFLTANYPGGKLVGIAVKAGSNSEVGQGEGELTILDSRFTQAQLQPGPDPVTGKFPPFDGTVEFKDLYDGGAFILSTPNNVGSGTGGGWSGAGTIGQAVDLGLKLSFNDPDGSESAYFIVEGVPNGVTLNHGFNNGDGTWTVLFDKADPTWKLTATSQYSGQATLKVTPVVVDNDPDGADPWKQFPGQTFNLVVTNSGGGVDPWPAPTASAPNLSGAPETGTEGQPFDLGGVTASATSGSLSAVVLVNLPADAKVVGTTDATGHTIAWYNPVKGSWTIDPNHLDDFKVQVHDDRAGTVTLDLRAVATSGGVTTTSSGSIAVVNLAPETDGASITANVGPAVEDAAGIGIALTVKDLETGYRTETLSDGIITVTIAPVQGVDGKMHLPGTLKTGLVNGMEVQAVAGQPGTYTIKLTPAQVQDFADGDAFTVTGLTFVPDANFSGGVDITFSTKVKDSGTDEGTSSSTITVTVTPDIDATTFGNTTAAGKEDQPIPLDLVINHQDVAGTGYWGSETVSVVISGVPAGARIEGATNNGPITVGGVTTYSWTVERSSAHMVAGPDGITLKGVNYVSPTDDSSDVTLTVTTYVFEKGVAEPKSASTTIIVGVDGVTDGVRLNPNDAVGIEDKLVAIDLGARLVDVTGSSEVVTLTLTGVPEGAKFFDMAGNPVGSKTAAGTWSFSEAEVKALDLTGGGKLQFQGPSNVSGSWTLTAQAFATDTDGSTAVTVASNALTFTVTLASDPDAPLLTVAQTTASVQEDGQSALKIHAELRDTDSESLAVVITGAPEGSLIRVNTGGTWQDFSGQNGVWTIPAGAATSLDNLYIKPPANYNGSFTLNVTASSTEKDGGSAWAETPKTIAVTVNAVNDAPTAKVTNGGIGVEAGTHSSPIYLLGGAAAVAFDDVDFKDAGATAVLSKMTLTISGSGLGAQDSLGLSGVPVTLAADGALVCHPDANTTIKVAYNPATHTLTFSGTATPEQYAALAEHVVLSSTSGVLAAGTREVTITAYDVAGQASAGGATAAVTVTVSGGATLSGAALGEVAFNAAGAVALQASTLATNEDAAPFALGLDMTLDAGVTARISGMPAGTIFHDALGNVVDANAVTAGQLSGLTVDLPDNWNGSATLTVSASANGTAVSEAVTINASPVNDAPVLGVATTSQQVVASANTLSAPIRVAGGSGVTATDVDGTITGMTVQLLPDADHAYMAGDTLGLYGFDVALNTKCDLVVKGTNITVSYNDADHTLTFSGTDPQVTYADLAKAVVLSSTGATLSTGTRSFAITLHDDSNAPSQSVTTTVDVTNGAATSAALAQDAHGTVYWNGATPVLNGRGAADTFPIYVGDALSVNGNGGTDTLSLGYQNGGWTFEFNTTDHQVHVVSADHKLDGIIHLEDGAKINPFTNGTHDVVFNGSANGTITFDHDTVVSFTSLEKLHGS